MLGARQVGKTWLMKEFGRREYENVAYINCDDEPLTHDLFTGDYDVERLVLSFQAISGEAIHEGTTLIILDELQEAPRGLHALKYFCEKAPGYHVMAAGSLLGVTLAQHDSFPVGKVDILRLYPMDFEEFLEAMGEGEFVRMMGSHDHRLEGLFADKLTHQLRQYYFVGGMPEIVLSYRNDKNLKEVRRLQSAILAAYRRDISKHTTKTESVRIGQVLGSMPSQLAKESKRFIYGAAKPGARATDFEMAIQWLIDAGLVYKIPRVSKIAVPLAIYEDLAAFKLYFLDVGLFGCMAGVDASAILLDAAPPTEFRGVMAEEYVAQQLVCAGFKPYYWTNPRTPAEIDFVIEADGEVIPIEVKASTNVRGKSIAQYAKENPGSRGVRFSLLGYERQSWLTNYPLYALPFYFGGGSVDEF